MLVRDEELAADALGVRVTGWLLALGEAFGCLKSGCIDFFFNGPVTEGSWAARTVAQALVGGGLLGASQVLGAVAKAAALICQPGVG